MMARFVNLLGGLVMVFRSRSTSIGGLEIGRRFDARPLVLPWPHCPHISIGGETGSGKSGVCNALIGALAGIPNVAICGIDLKLVELSPWRDRLTVLAVTPAEADRLLVDLRNLIRHRAQWLEDNGYRKWQDEFGPWVVLVVDELAELQALDVDVLADAIDDPASAQGVLRSGRSGQQVRTALLGSLARMARFCGVTIVGATQYPSAEVLDQQIRTQLTIRIMLRVASGEQVNVCLGQGYGTSISPTSIGPNERGGLWIVGTPDAPKPVRARAHWVTDTDVAARVAATRHLTPPAAHVFAGTGPEPVEEAY
ncbi:MAG: FtsK/SpoIIIE domain-containing protein [Acidimicrobiales bacterium]